jgi:hypothetical protein
MNERDMIDSARDGLSHMLRAALPDDYSFVVLTFPANGKGPVQGTCSTNCNPAVAIRKIGEAAVAIKEKAGL